MKHLTLAFALAATTLSACAHAQTAPAVPARATPAAPSAEALAAVRARLPQDEIIYFVLPDRFENGDPSNDRGGLSGGPLQTGFDPTHKGFFHGGDLRGLINRLDYIQGLGATAIWLAPVFKNKPVQGGPGEESAGYHGYWVTDFTTIDPHFGTEDDFRELVNAAHARGMKVYMDIIANHTADVITYTEGAAENFPYRSIADYPDTAYTPVVPAAERDVKVPAWLNDPRWYHNRGNTLFRNESSIMGDFVGLDDLATENPRVIEGFIEIFGSWIDRFGIDGFRIDTARHVNPEFWQAFNPAMLERARARGIPNFHIFGEVAIEEINPGALARFTRVDRYPAVLDFPFQSAIRAVVAGNQSPALFERLFSGDALYEGGEPTALQLPTFLGNHDMGRIGTFIRQANPQASDAEQLARLRLANALMLTLRGVPTIYYGDEQGFVGDGNDQAAREDMFPSRTASYNDNDLVGTDATTAVSNFDTSHPLYRTIAELSAIRRAHPALTRGRQQLRTWSDDPGLFSVSRFDPESGREYILAFNTSNQPIRANMIVERGSSRFTALSGPCPATARVPGSVTVSLEPFGYMICAAEPTE
ncbi:alpha-amylase [Sphingomonas lacunae]|uniref:Alpha-amylase n=1 Tax=Sphingomonas lacunae TaxID=2698828 RepID=A0A6M4AS11_9SPHN|nr:alpha-amylase family glycosyl hydrolase [Sphingomonas lacunae]QJQ31496.1 alpha-amylase [Sphingomonas lacunae]